MTNVSGSHGLVAIKPDLEHMKYDPIVLKT